MASSGGLVVEPQRLLCLSRYGSMVPNEVLPWNETPCRPGIGICNKPNAARLVGSGREHR